MRKLRAILEVLSERGGFNYYEQQLIAEVIAALGHLPDDHPYVRLATLIAKEHCEQSERDDNWLNKHIRERNILLWKKCRNEPVSVDKNELQQKKIKESLFNDSAAGDAGKAIDDVIEAICHDNDGSIVSSCEFPLIAETPFLLVISLGHSARVSWFVKKYPMMMPVRETVVDFVTEYDDSSQLGSTVGPIESLAKLQRQERYGVQRPFEHRLIDGLYRYVCASRQSDDAIIVNQKLRLIVALIKDDKQQFRLIQSVLSNAASQGPSVLLILLLAARHQLLLRLLPQISPRLALANVASHPHWESAPVYTAEITKEVSVMYGIVEDMRAALEDKNEIIAAFSQKLSEMNKAKPVEAMSSCSASESELHQKKLIQLLRERVYSLQEERRQLKVQLESSLGNKKKQKGVANKKRKSKKKKPKQRVQLAQPSGASVLGQDDNNVVRKRADDGNIEREALLQLLNEARFEIAQRKDKEQTRIQTLEHVQRDLSELQVEVKRLQLERVKLIGQCQQAKASVKKKNAALSQQQNNIDNKQLELSSSMTQVVLLKKKITALLEERDQLRCDRAALEATRRMESDERLTLVSEKRELSDKLEQLSAVLKAKRKKRVKEEGGASPKTTRQQQADSSEGQFSQVLLFNNVVFCTHCQTIEWWYVYIWNAYQCVLETNKSLNDHVTLMTRLLGQKIPFVLKPQGVSKGIDLELDGQCYFVEEESIKRLHSHVQAHIRHCEFS